MNYSFQKWQGAFMVHLKDILSKTKYAGKERDSKRVLIRLCK